MTFWHLVYLYLIETVSGRSAPTCRLFSCCLSSMLHSIAFAFYVHGWFHWTSYLASPAASFPLASDNLPSTWLSAGSAKTQFWQNQCLAMSAKAGTSSRRSRYINVWWVAKSEGCLHVEFIDPLKLIDVSWGEFLRGGRCNIGMKGALLKFFAFYLVYFLRHLFLLVFEALQ